MYAVLLASSNAPNWGKVNNAKRPLIIPDAAITPTTGLMEPVITPIKLPNARLTGFLPSSTGAVSSAGASARFGIFFITASKTLVTSFPITTWYWPDACNTSITPSVSFKISSWALPSSFKLKRRRVIQWTKLFTFSCPPTLSIITSAKAS